MPARVRLQPPLSLGGLVAAALLYGLQHVPVIGFAGVFLGSLFWAALLVNGAFIAATVEVFVRRLNRLWLILPAAWFGLYAGYAAWERWQVSRLGAELAAANARVRLSFDPARMALVGQGDSAAGTMLTDYGLPVVYERAEQSGKASYRASRLADMAFCREIWNDQDVRAAGIYTTGFHDEVEGSLTGLFEERFCLLSSEEAPSLPQLLVVTREAGKAPGLPQATLSETTLTLPDGRRHRLMGGHAEALPWFPMPVATCFGSWVPQSAKEPCALGFYRGTWLPIVNKGSQFGSDGISLAEALGLRRVPREARQASDMAAIKALIARGQTEALALDMADLRRVLADPFARIDTIPFRTLRRNPESYTALAPQIARAFAATITSDYRGQDNGRNLARLLADLPPRAFAAVRPVIEAAYARPGCPWIGHGTPELRGRLAQPD